MTRLSYRIAEVAALTGLSPDMVEDEIRDGHLPAKKARRAVVILASDLERYLDGLPPRAIPLGVVAEPIAEVRPTPTKAGGRRPGKRVERGIPLEILVGGQSA